MCTDGDCGRAAATSSLPFFQPSLLACLLSISLRFAYRVPYLELDLLPVDGDHARAELHPCLYVCICLFGLGWEVGSASRSVGRSAWGRDREPGIGFQTFAFYPAHINQATISPCQSTHRPIDRPMDQSNRSDRSIKSPTRACTCVARTDGQVVHGLEALVGELEQQARFAHTLDMNMDVGDAHG
jgi:hypothetical protein